MTNKKKHWTHRLVVSVGFVVINFGEAWLIAYLAKPQFTTGTVNFLARLYAVTILAILNLTKR